MVDFFLAGSQSGRLAKTFNMQNVILIQHFRANRWKKKKSVYACSVAQLCRTLCDPMDCNSPGSSVRGISQARILGWVAISYSRGYSRPRDWTCVSCIGRQILYHGATWEAKEEWGTPYLVRGSRLEAATHKCVACLIQVGLLWALPWKLKYWLTLQSMYRWGDPDSSLRTLKTNMRKMWFRDWEHLEIVRSWLTS